MSESAIHCVLSDWGALRVSGPDTVAFLQGQLSQDLQRLDSARALPAGLHNPQGRVVALAWLRVTTDGVRMMLPATMLGAVATRLRRFVLRSKVAIDELAATRILGVRDAAGHDLRLDATAPGDEVSLSDWRRREIADGIAEVVPATSEMFVAQMLNLDCIDAVSWTKGCYTGQEVIARAHYRGRVKRRLQRFAFDTPPPVPGTQVALSSGETALVVRAVARDEGGSEVLAVAPLGVASLPLPYPLPE